MDHQQIYNEVSTVYSNAISAEIKDKEITGLAGYTSTELQDLSAGSSFGCGNPLAFSEVKEGQSVLDLGSGAGLDLIIASKKVGKSGNVIGVDMTDKMIDMAKVNIEKSGLENIEVRKGFIENLPVESSSVDWVISNCVINLSPNKEKVFSEIYRVLKPSGKMLISDITVNGWAKWAVQMGNLLPKKTRDMLHFSCVSAAVGEKEYSAWLEKIGFTQIEIRGRMVYEVSQMKVILESGNYLKDLRGWQEKWIYNLIKIVSGKVWSAKFFAQKP